MSKTNPESDRQHASEKRTTPSSVEASATTDEDVINAWLRSTYVRHDLEDGSNTILTINDFLEIIRTTGTECNIQDESLNLALALLVRTLNRSDATLVSVLAASNLYALGAGSLSKEDVSSAHPMLLPKLVESGKR